MPPLEPDVPMQPNTFRRMAQQVSVGLKYFRAYFGRRLQGFAIGLMSDAIAEAATQSFFARLPGHPQQAPDSLARVGLDRDLHRFRGETDAAWLTRIFTAWDDYEQGGTRQVMLKIINLWGVAGWPSTWNAGTITLVESVVPTVFEFTLTIPYGNILPIYPPETYGGGLLYGASGLFYGIGLNTDFNMLIYLVRKWKPARSRGYVKVYYDVSNFILFRV